MTTSPQNLTSPIFAQIRQLLMRCDEFQSNRALQAMFADPDLSPFEAKLNEAESVQERVDLFLAYFKDKEHSEHGPLLILFIKKLIERYPPEDQLHLDLAELYHTLVQEPSKSPTARQTVTPSNNLRPTSVDTPTQPVHHPQTKGKNKLINSIRHLQGNLAANLGNDLDEILYTARKFKRLQMITQALTSQNEHDGENQPLFPEYDLIRVGELAGSISATLNSIADRVAAGKQENKLLYSSAEANLDTLVKILPRISDWLRKM